MKSLIWGSLISIRENLAGPLFRRFGKKLYQAGVNLEGCQASQDRLVPSLRNLSYQNHQPQLESTSFVAPNATVLGDVKVGQQSSIWYNSTLLGNSPIRIGNRSILQDRTHLSKTVTIGDNVFVGPNATIQNSSIKDWGFVSMGATVRQSQVEQGGFVAAGAVIGNNSIVKQGQIWAGNPGRFLRNMTPVERQIIRDYLEEMHSLAAIHNEQTQKNFREVITGKTQPYDIFDFDQLMQNLATYPLSYSQLDEQFVERRVFMKQKFQYPNMGKDYQPYDYDNQQIHEKYRVGIHEQQLKKVATKIKEKQNFSTDRGPWKNKF